MDAIIGESHDRVLKRADFADILYDQPSISLWDLVDKHQGSLDVFKLILSGFFQLLVDINCVSILYLHHKLLVLVYEFSENLFICLENFINNLLIGFFVLRDLFVICAEGKQKVKGRDFIFIVIQLLSYTPDIVSLNIYYVQLSHVEKLLQKLVYLYLFVQFVIG